MYTIWSSRFIRSFVSLNRSGTSHTSIVSTGVAFGQPLSTKRSRLVSSCGTSADASAIVRSRVSDPSGASRSTEMWVPLQRQVICRSRVSMFSSFLRGRLPQDHQSKLAAILSVLEGGGRAESGVGGHQSRTGTGRGVQKVARTDAPLGEPPATEAGPEARSSWVSEPVA